MSITILRLGHRLFRDQRLTTHVFLVARALSATRGFYTGERDNSLEESVKSLVSQWGGVFEVRYIENQKNILKSFKGKIVHLTAYGIPFSKKLKEIRKAKNLLIIVGGEKVPSEIYQKADWNLSVSSQPHSEVAALGIFLYELQGRKFRPFRNARLRIIPKEKGKMVSLGKKK